MSAKGLRRSQEKSCYWCAFTKHLCVYIFSSLSLSPPPPPPPFFFSFYNFLFWLNWLTKQTKQTQIDWQHTLKAKSIWTFIPSDVNFLLETWKYLLHINYHIPQTNLGQISMFLRIHQTFNSRTSLCIRSARKVRIQVELYTMSCLGK